MGLHFFYLILFSSMLIAIILFIICFVDEFKKIKGHFKYKQYFICILGNSFILTGLSLSCLLYFYKFFLLGLSVFIAFNGIVAYFLYEASIVIKGGD